MTFRELWESEPRFNILDYLKVGDGVYQVVAIDATDGDHSPYGVVSLCPHDGTRFVRDTDDPDSEADYYRVPLSILKAAGPKVCQYQSPLFT
jgi:hypothetical protein